MSHSPVRSAQRRAPGGNETPLKLNSGLLVLADETVTLEPLALSVAVKLLFWPTVMLPKSSVVGDNSNWPDAVAVPESAIDKLEFEASDTMRCCRSQCPRMSAQRPC